MVRIHHKQGAPKIKKVHRSIVQLLLFVFLGKYLKREQPILVVLVIDPKEVSPSTGDRANRIVFMLKVGFTTHWINTRDVLVVCHIEIGQIGGDSGGSDHVCKVRDRFSCEVHYISTRQIFSGLKTAL
jgi:hypothetical protein